jgi:hypothetical protein
MYFWRRTPQQQAPAAARRDVKSLPPWGTSAGAWFQRHAGRRGARNLPSSGTAAGLYHSTTRRQGLFYFFSFSFLKHF